MPAYGKVTSLKTSNVPTTFGGYRTTSTITLNNEVEGQRLGVDKPVTVAAAAHCRRQMPTGNHHSRGVYRSIATTPRATRELICYDKMAHQQKIALFALQNAIRYSTSIRSCASVAEWTKVSTQHSTCNVRGSGPSPGQKPANQAVHPFEADR